MLRVFDVGGQRSERKKWLVFLGFFFSFGDVAEERGKS